MAADIIAFEKRAKEKLRERKEAAKPKSTRFEALDVLRGLFVMGMILANNAGDWGHIYKQMDHVEWHGFTLTDMIFPGFMVCVGLSMTLSLGRRMKEGGKQAMALHAARRALILVAIGLFLNLLPGFDFGHWRLPGVLQRIGICYGIASGLVLLHSHTTKDGQLILHARPLAIWGVGFLLAYGLLLRFVPVPGFGANRFDSEGSWPAYIDRIVFGLNHIWKYGMTEGRTTYDPEGLLSTFPAVFNILAGILAGLYINAKGAKNSIATVFIGGLLLFLAASALDGQIPIIKKLWTPSFALLTVGFALMSLSVLMLIVDRLGFKAWAWPIRLYGTNAILAYVGAWVIAVIGDLPLITTPHGQIGANAVVYGWIHGAIADPYAASATFAFAMLALIGVLLVPFYLKRWYLKI